MIWNFNSSSMGQPNVNEWKQAMGFYTRMIDMFNIFERACKWILGQVKDLNYFTWFLV